VQGGVRSDATWRRRESGGGVGLRAVGWSHGEQSLEKQPPSAEEAAMMHSLFVGRANIFGELSRDGGRI
jgi:hypothetical protein